MSVKIAAVTGSAPRSNMRWWVFLLFMVIITVNYIDRSSLPVALPFITKQQHLSPTVTGVILSAFFWTYAAMQIPSGWLADKIKPRLLTTGSVVGWGLAEALTAVASGAGILMLLRLLLGVFEGPIYPAGAKLNAVWLTSGERARGGTIIDSGAPLGTALGGITMVAFIGWFGSWQLAFVVAGILTILLGLFAGWFIRNTPHEHPMIDPSEASYIEKSLEEENRGVTASSRGNLFRYFKFPSFWAMCIGWLGFDVVFYGLLSWVPTYLTKYRHIPFALSGASVFIIFGSGFVGELVGGQLADAWRRRGGNPNVVLRTLLGIAGAITTISLFLVAYAPTAQRAVMWLAIVLFFLRWAGIYWSIPSILTDGDHAGLLGGAMNFAGNVGGILAPIVVGLILSATHSFVGALLLFAGSGLVWMVSSLIINYSKKLAIVD